MNHKDKKIITLFVTNVAQLTAYLYPMPKYNYL